MSWFFANPYNFNNSDNILVTNRPINLAVISTHNKTLATPIGTSEQLSAIVFSVDGSAADQYLYYPDAPSRDADFSLLELALEATNPSLAGWHTATPQTFINSKGNTILNKPINLDVVVTFDGVRHKPIGTNELLYAIRFDVTDRSSSKYLYYPDKPTRDADLLIVQNSAAYVDNNGGADAECDCFTQEVISSAFIIADYGGDIDLENCNLKHYILTDVQPQILFNGNAPLTDVLFKITLNNFRDVLVEDQAVFIPFVYSDKAGIEYLFAIKGGGTVTLAFNSALQRFYVTGDIANDDFLAETVFSYAPQVNDLQTNTSNSIWTNQLDLGIGFVRPGQYVAKITTGFNSNSTNSDIEMRTILNNDFANPLGFGQGYSIKKEPKDAAGNWGGTGSNQREAVTFCHSFEVTGWGQVVNLKLQFKPQTNGVEASLWNTFISIERTN